MPKPPITPYRSINIGTFTAKTDKEKAEKAMMLPEKFHSYI